MLYILYMPKSLDKWIMSIIIFSSLISVLGIYLFSLTKQLNPTSVIKSSISPKPTVFVNITGTIDWQTYVNSAYKFSFSYPSNYNVSDNEQSYPSPLGKQVISINSDIGKSQRGIPTNRVVIVFSDNPDNLSLSQWATNPPHEKDSSASSASFIKQNRVTSTRSVNGMSAFEETFSSIPPTGFQGGHFYNNVSRNVYLKKNSTIISFLAVTPKSDWDAFTPVFDQILSTFRFLN